MTHCRFDVTLEHQGPKTATLEDEHVFMADDPDSGSRRHRAAWSLTEETALVPGDFGPGENGAPRSTEFLLAVTFYIYEDSMPAITSATGKDYGEVLVEGDASDGGSGGDSGGGNQPASASLTDASFALVVETE